MSSSSSTDVLWFVNTRNMAEHLISFLGGEKVESLRKKCQSVYDEKRTGPLVDVLLSESAQRAFKIQKDENDLVTYFFVLCTLTLETGEDKYVNRFAEIISSGDDRAAMRLKILINMYNQCGQDRHYTVLGHILDVASRTNQESRVRSFVNRVDSLLETWKLNAESKRALYFKIANAFGTDTEMKIKYLTHYIKTFENETDASKLASDEVKRAASEIVISAVQNTSNVIENIGLIQLRAVSQLKDDKEFGTLYQLLHIFTCEDVPEFVKFLEKNKVYVTEKLKIDSDSAMENMRLLSLCSLAGKTSGNIAYDDAAKALQVSKELVERYVLKAVSAGLLDAKMDQFNETIIIYSAAQRSFGIEKWKQIQEKLRRWQKQVSAVKYQLSKKRSSHNTSRRN